MRLELKVVGEKRWSELHGCSPYSCIKDINGLYRHHIMSKMQTLPGINLAHTHAHTLSLTSTHTPPISINI